MSKIIQIPPNLYELYVLQQYSNEQIRKVIGCETLDTVKKVFKRAGIEYRPGKRGWNDKKQRQEIDFATCKISMMTPEQLSEYQAKTKNTEQDIRSIRGVAYDEWRK